MITTRSVTQKNSNIAYEWGRDGKISDNTQHTRNEAEKNVHPRRSSRETKITERRQMKYEYKGRMCPTCFIVKSLGTNECNCD